MGKMKPSGLRRDNSPLKRVHDYLGLKMDFAYREGQTLHIPGHMVWAIEDHLKTLPHYRLKIPKSYADGSPEDLGLREVTSPLSGIYRNIPVRFGQAELDIFEKGLKEKMNSELMFCLDNPEEFSSPDRPGRWELSGSYSAVALHENGAISAAYGIIPREPNPVQISEIPGINCVAAWHPPGKPELGNLPHPTSEQEVYSTMSGLWEKSKSSYRGIGVYKAGTPGMEKIPPLVMLAVDAYQSVGRC